MTKRICLACRRTFEGEGSRCLLCQRAWAKQRNSVRTWYRDPAYIRASKLVRQTATHCHLCGKPFTDPRDPVQADHITPTELRPAHRSCNAGRGRNHPVFGRQTD